MGAAWVENKQIQRHGKHHMLLAPVAGDNNGVTNLRAQTKHPQNRFSTLRGAEIRTRVNKSHYEIHTRAPALRYRELNMLRTVNAMKKMKMARCPASVERRTTITQAAT